MTPTELKEARRKLGLSAPQMAAMLGLGYGNYRHMEMAPGKTTSRPVMPTTERLILAYLDGYRPADWPTAPAKGDRILLKDQTDATKNGIYEWGRSSKP